MVPFVFVLEPSGIGLLLKTPPDGSWAHVAWIAATACAGIAALAAGAQDWALRACRSWERWVLVASGLLLVYPANWSDAIGCAGVAAVIAAQWLTRPRVAAG